MKNLLTKQISAPRWTNGKIVDAAQRLMVQYESIVGRDYIKKEGLHFDHFYERVIFPKFNISLYEDEDLGVDADGRKLLGRFDIRGNVAHLDQAISRESKDPRRIFTCWHEVAGHGVLQGEWLRNQLDPSSGCAFIDVTEYSLSPYDERILERQANLFASHLAAPGWLIKHAIEKIFRPNGPFVFKEPCNYWLDVQGLGTNGYVVDAGQLCQRIGSKISGHFGGLSAEAIGYRIAELGWVRDLSKRDLHLRRASRRDGAYAKPGNMFQATVSGCLSVE